MPTDGLRAPDTRHAYVITYSKADISKFPFRQDFAEALVLAFSKDMHYCHILAALLF